MSTLQPSYWVIFCQDALLLQVASDGTLSLPYSIDCPIPLEPWQHVIPLFDTANIPYHTVRIDSPYHKDTRYTSCTLRESYSYLTEMQYRLCGRAYQLHYWESITHYCGICGAPLQRQTSISKQCTQCHKEWWPQLSPAIIVLIKRGEEILLVQSKKFKTDYYGLVAGFVEPGETLEECVRREVYEETSLHVTDIRYYASQPWPYPSGLMVGFVAQYQDGDLHIQRQELRKGDWFTAQTLPSIPAPLSIARCMIDAWLQGQI